jgi:DNA-binding winged helix-turn-helix (wHTH) protein
MGDRNFVWVPGKKAAAAPHRYLGCGCFVLDLEGRTLIDPCGREVTLRRREFDLLLTLARSPGRVMSRATLLDAIAGREAEAFDRTIDVYIGRLRRKIEADPERPRLIVTVPGVGYRLAGRQTRTSIDSDGQRMDAAASRIGFDILAAVNKANAERDIGSMSSLYAVDATMIKTGRLLSGRSTIVDSYARFYEKYHPDPSRLEHVTAIGAEMMLRAGSWSGTYRGPHGPVPLAGSWTTTDVCDDGAWKIHTETIFIHPGSYRPSSSVTDPRWNTPAAQGCRDC